jgi:bifunctional UDP-N-acetylglucosamine pyrophosphorylase/glucosamine-1-phosphate N-acetyltransferase
MTKYIGYPVAFCGVVHFRVVGGLLVTLMTVASIVLAAGRGSRMKGYEGNKTLLPLIPGEPFFTGKSPMLIHILQSLPEGPKALVVHHKKEEVRAATRSFRVTYCEQPELNGTGGAVLAAKNFIQDEASESFIITMGDVPLVKPSTYSHLVAQLPSTPFVVLGFRPSDKKQYGVLELDGHEVARIVEWKYWKTYSKERRDQLTICNSGIYAARTKDFLPYLSRLEESPHKVHKEREGQVVEFQEFFITDIVEFMHRDGLKVGYVVAENEDEIMGVDDLPSLEKAQRLFQASAFHSTR